MPRLLRHFASLLLALGAAVPLVAQSSGTTGSLFGNVKDTEGKALPGVTVSITSPSLQGGRTAITSTTGDYNFPLLPPGSYRVESALSGFEPQIRDGVVVSLNKATKVNVAMSLSRVSEA